MTVCFLDTSALLDLRRRHEEVRAAILKFEAAVINAVVLGELRAGVRRTARPELELARLEIILRGLTMKSIDAQTAIIYGDLRGDLESQGCRIPTDDIWIAATCVQFDLLLVSRDTHFDRIPQLTRIVY